MPSIRTALLSGSLYLAFTLPLCTASAAFGQSYFNYWSRCSDARLAPERRVEFCTRLLDNGGGPDSEITVLTVLGGLHRQQHNYDRAIQSYTRAVGYQALGVAEKRESVISRGSLVSLPSANALVGAYEGRAEVYALMHKPDLALADTGEIFKLAPDSANAYAIRCRIRTIADVDLDKALADCTEAMKRAPDDTQVLGAAGLLQYRLGHLKLAATDFDKAIAASPKLAGGLYVRGLIALKEGDAATGNADIAAAKAEDPGIADSFSDFGVEP